MGDIIFDRTPGSHIPRATVTDKHDLSAPAPNGTELENSRTGMSADALRRGIDDHLRYTLGRPAALLEPKHYYQALSLAVRDRMQDRWTKTTQTYLETSAKVACYLSAEFLLGPHLGNNLLNLGLEDEARAALAEMGQDFDEVLGCEEEPGLGNGGLGRLAACYLDSLATLQRPAIGYGIRYEFGIFDQDIRDGWQVEKTDYWLADPNPWEIVKTDLDYDRRLGWAHRALHRRTRPRSGALGSATLGQGRLLRHPDSGLRGEQLQHACTVERPGHQVAGAGRLQRRRLLPSGGRGGGVRDRHQGALSE